MDTIRMTLPFVLDIAILGYLFYFIYMSLFQPVRFALFGPFGPSGWGGLGLAGRSPDPSPKDITILLIVLVGLGIFIYHGTVFMFSWMPDSWVLNPGDDDEFVTYGQLLGGLFAVLGSIGILYGLIQSASRIEELDRDNEVLLHSFNHIRAQIDRLETTINSISRGHSSVTITQVLDELAIETCKLDWRVVRNEFKKYPTSFLDDYKDPRTKHCYYSIDVAPSFKLGGIMRQMKLVTLPGTVIESAKTVLAKLGAEDRTSPPEPIV